MYVFFVSSQGGRKMGKGRLVCVGHGAFGDSQC
jgi:hypothetical protein